LIAIHKVPDIYSSVTLPPGGLANGYFHSLFFTGWDVNQGIPSAEEEFKIVTKTHDLWGM
jgi:hypothetical protein